MPVTIGTVLSVWRPPPHASYTAPHNAHFTINADGSLIIWTGQTMECAFAPGQWLTVNVE